jgi:4,5-DOPA dioxygenase extradiol
MKKMPAIFIGHGNPLNALNRNSFTDAWRAIGRSIPRPRAILSISAHYYIPFSMVTSSKTPPTIHDFSGFPEKLYQTDYPAPGSPALARRVKDLLAPHPVRSDDHWGLDHGTWSVLTHMFPDADIPVVQLSIDETRAPGHHYETGARLMALREEGVLIIGSGNIVHNLALYNWEDREVQAFEWARRFEDRVRESLGNGRHDALIDYGRFGKEADLAVPTPDHYLPFLYILGLGQNGDKISFPVQGMDGGSVSMLAVKIG